DVTDSLRIYNVTILEDGETAAIVYYAKDSSNNIASARRIAVYEGPGTNEKTNVEVDSSDNHTGSESGFNVVTLPDTEKNQNSESTQSQASGQEESSAAADSDQDTGKPVIILSRNSVTVAYRSSFNSLAYIQDIKDDKDSYDSLFRRIVLESDVSTKRRGNYTAEMYVVDSDGNKSDVVTLHVRVD
ncbi:MAG: hypothetical protein II627_05770, partial [Lachnospiraceae bacterium]|nr:hypothetical protein [Lachnospiraceae bacterium]